jgi:hypothetical protein
MASRTWQRPRKTPDGKPEFQIWRVPTESSPEHATDIGGAVQPWAAALLNSDRAARDGRRACIPHGVPDGMLVETSVQDCPDAWCLCNFVRGINHRQLSATAAAFLRKQSKLVRYSIGAGRRYLRRGVRFNDKSWFDDRGILTVMRAVAERFRRPNFGRMEIHTRDPKAYTKPGAQPPVALPDTELIEHLRKRRDREHMVGK